jgi:biotin transport system permease protein
MFELCTTRETWLHRIPAGLKLLVLALAGAGVFLTTDQRILAGCIGFAMLLPVLAWLPLRSVLRQVYPAAILIAVLAGFHLFMDAPDLAFEVTARLGTVILLAISLTLTTRVSHMVDAMERGLFPLRWIGINPAKVGLMFSLAIRFIPVLFALIAEIREAQKTRGLERSVFAVVMPLMVRTLRMGDDVADAISARAYDSD